MKRKKKVKQGDVTTINAAMQLVYFPFSPLGYQTVMPNQQPSYQSVVQPPSQPLVSGQHSNMGNQMQGMMVQYPSVPSYQVRLDTFSMVTL